MEPFEYKLSLDMCSVDFLGCWQPGAVFRAMQEAADGQCHELRLTYDDLRQHGLAWVMTRAHLQLDQAPQLGQTVTIRTWPGATRHMFFPRYFTFEVDGHEVGRASALYVLLDASTRKIALPSRCPAPIPVCDKPAPLPFPGNLLPMSAQAEERVYQPCYMDLDMNRHVNNTRYIDWYMNQFGVETHAAQRPVDLLVHYMNEVKPDARVTLTLREEGGVRTLTGMDGDTACFAVQGIWKARGEAQS